MPHINLPHIFYIYQENLQQKTLHDKLYDKMRSDDTAGVALEILDIMMKTNTIPPLVKTLKDKSASTTFRNDGNKAYKGGEYQKALEFYNKALMLAPKGTEELVLAYSNRSALFLQCKAFQACLNDTETCLSLGCPKPIKNKLLKRKTEAQKHVWMEQAVNLRSKFCKEFFLLNETRNPQIPCASTDVEVVVTSGVPSVVAANHVKVGKLLAVEEAFVTDFDPDLVANVCTHCNRMSLNLSPCENCCFAMFCSNECQQNSTNEYHRIECPIIELLREISLKLSSFRATMKLRCRLGSWEKFIKATSKLGLELTAESEICDVFDGKSNSSVLNFSDDTTFLYGRMYNLSFGCALILNYLARLKSFFPSSSEDKKAAMRAWARVFMYFQLHGKLTPIFSAMLVLMKQERTFNDKPSLGMFPFVGKLKRSCVPNVEVVGLNNRAALVALQPLEPGTELTIAPLGNFLERDYKVRERQFFYLTIYGTVCGCLICNESYKTIETAKLSETQLRRFEKLNLKGMIQHFSDQHLEDAYQRSCKALALLSDQKFTAEYREAYFLFRKCQLDMQDWLTSNVRLQ